MAKIKGLFEILSEALDMDAAYEGVKRLGLKADNTAADRAKALGFDTKVYHGSVKDITEFDPSMAGIEGHLGKSIYLTDNPVDASRNYARINAPDISAKAERYVDSLSYSQPKVINKELQRLKRIRQLRNPKPRPKVDKLLAQQEDEYALLMKDEWLNNFKDNEGVVYPLAFRKGNQLDVTRKSNDYIDFSPKWDKAGEEIIEENKNLNNLHDSLSRQARKYDFDYDYASSQLDDFFDEYPASGFNNNLRGNFALNEATDKAGNVVNNEVRRQIYEDLGYDSVKINANDEFGLLMDGIDNTNHHMVFDPANIRSKFARFNPRLAGVGAGSILSADLLANEQNQPTSLLDYNQAQELPEQSHINMDNLKRLGSNAYGVGKDMVQDPSLLGEVISGGLLNAMNVASPFIKGAGIGGVLIPSDINASEKYTEEEMMKMLQRKRTK